ncbi:DUF2537 domain-containing protein [Amycolatopsis nigrescens]|uniref:DUF2537 domain-containing protein n=1 Tax=Amycolatopsis nigrescens TaxID=381445 RepID=UPI000399A856|nr:DUF2537 domain-containing protein [Amycolatopsis nigrescens]
MELRIRGERAVLAGHGGQAREIDPHSIALGTDLADALHEWARVAAAVRRAGPRDSAEPTEAAAVVSQRGRQLAGRLAAVMGTTVHYLDPVTETAVVVPPPQAAQPPPVPAARARIQRLFGAAKETNEPTPWATGLTVAGFVAAFVIVAMLALAGTLATETSGWLAVVAALVVSAGLAPSLWLVRRLPIVRWVALGAAAGMVLSWIGVLFVAF